jgi:hypothetical protein
VHDLSREDSVGAARFFPLLRKSIGEVPGMPGFAFSVSEGAHCCQFILSYRGASLATGGVAWGPAENGDLWRWLGDYYDSICPWVPGWGNFGRRTPPALPWLAVVQDLNLGLISGEQARKLAAVERDLARAVIQRALTRN